jgi:peptidoglycan/xylan/chitin deacetylase (PgdA/CDA1 family)
MEARAITLTFHGVGDPPRALDPGESDVWISRERLDALLDAAAERGDVRITFDDGNISDLEHALPALRARGLEATFFVVAGRIGMPGFIDASGLRALAAAGMGIGSHGMRHRSWRRLDDRARDEELVRAKSVLEQIVQHPVTEAACPFGGYDRRAVAGLRSAGYCRVFTSDRGATRPNHFLQPRNSVKQHDGPDILGQIAALDRRPDKALRRRAKLAVKQWR